MTLKRTREATDFIWVDHVSDTENELILYFTELSLKYFCYRLYLTVKILFAIIVLL